MRTKSSNVLRLEIKRVIDDSYDLVFDSDFQFIASDLKERDIAHRFAVITDTNVGPIYAGELESALNANGLEARIFSFEAGEENKTMDTAKMLAGQMARAKYGRDCAVIALGGGVVGDTAGFVAGITRRGVPYVQIPTSTLAMADSSIGGKTGVDLEEGKNLVGLFKQPAVVYFVMGTIATLDDRNYTAGLAETVKHGVIEASDFFGYLEAHPEWVLEKDNHALSEIARNNCMIKGLVVEKDPEEHGLRKILNYGHTVGHAVETLSDYQLPHGECVSIGMMAAGRIAIAMGTGFREQDLKRQGDLLSRLGLPLAIPAGISGADIINVTALDKKAKNGVAKYCLPTGIGMMHSFSGAYAANVESSVVEKALEQTR